MFQFNLHFEFIFQVSCQCICGIYASVLAPCTTEAHNQVAEAATDVFLNSNINNIKHAVQKNLHFSLLLQVINNLLITAMNGFEFFMTAGIIDTPAIENKSTAIPAQVFWNLPAI